MTGETETALGEKREKKVKFKFDRRETRVIF